MNNAAFIAAVPPAGGVLDHVAGAAIGAGTGLIFGALMGGISGRDSIILISF